MTETERLLAAMNHVCQPDERRVAAGFIVSDGLVLFAKRESSKRIAPAKWHLPGATLKWANEPSMRCIVRSGKSLAARLKSVRHCTCSNT